MDVAPRGDMRGYHRERLREALENDIPLVVAKTVIAMVGGDGDAAEPFRIGLNFGTRYRCGGWGRGLTMHVCFMNLLDVLDQADRPRALYQGIAAVSEDTVGQPARFVVRALPTATTDLPVLKRWFRQFVEVRDSEGAERCLVSALRAGADDRDAADMMLAAATDLRYIDFGHVLDFTNKAFEALDAAGWEYAEQTLTSLAGMYARADRMEESNSWRHPVDLIVILSSAFEELEEAYAKGAVLEPRQPPEDLTGVLLGDDPHAIAEALLAALRKESLPRILRGPSPTRPRFA